MKRVSFVGALSVVLIRLVVVLILLVRPASAQRITEFPVPAVENSLADITSGPDGALWYGVVYAGRVDRITTGGTETSPFVLPGSSPGAFTNGPDGALWFTDGLRIRRLTPGGQSTEFFVNQEARDITSGSDGAIWFAYGHVGRLSTGGTLTQYDNAPGSLITPGADGALWTVGSFFGTFYLTQITTSGTITQFPIPLPPATFPKGLVQGPDGAFWFTLHDENKIARATTSGVYSEFPLPTAGSAPFGITTGPDGALWFTEEYANRIGRITTSGVITEYPIPTENSAPRGITTGPDGNLWFVESYASVVARLEPNRAAALDFLTVSPCRAVDTRDPVGPRGGPALQNAVRRDFHLTETCGVPQGAVAVAANVTAVGGSAGGDLRGFPPAFHEVRTSLLNFAAGQTRAGNAVLRLGPFGDLTLLSGMSQPGTVHVVIDVVGYFQ